MPEAASHVALGLDPQWLSAGIFLLTYAVLVSERVHRTITVLLGAGLMILFGIIDQEQAVEGVDFNTIALLTGMMILVGITERCGVFQYVALWVTKAVKAEPRGILLLLATVTAVFSALFDNVTTVLLIVPVTLLIVEKLELSPYPFLFAEIFSSNVGGTATLIGDPPNILIGSAVGLSFTDFLNELGPVVVVIHLLTLALFYLIWGRKLKTSESCRARVMAFEERDSITDPRLLRQSMAVMAPVWWALSLGACLGGNGTLIGASANVIVTGFAERAGYPLGFIKFMLLATPLMLLSVLIGNVYLYLRHFA